MRRRIGLSMRLVENQSYKETRDGIAHDWYPFLRSTLPEADWLLVPNVGSGVTDYISRWDLTGFIFSGGGDVGAAPERDQTERSLLEFAIKKGLPVFGVCRGMQMIQAYFGGKISDVSPEGHVGQQHLVLLTDGSSRTVNSYHSKGIEAQNLGKDLVAWVQAPDGSVEGMKHRTEKIYGVMWHPERQNPYSIEDQKLLREIFMDRKK